MASESECTSSIPVRNHIYVFPFLRLAAEGRKVFRSFLRCEYSEENILFWLACEDLKKERSPELIEEKARIIYEDYVSILSPREVRIIGEKNIHTARIPPLRAVPSDNGFPISVTLSPGARHSEPTKVYTFFQFPLCNNERGGPLRLKRSSWKIRRTR